MVDEATVMMFGGQADRRKFRDALARAFSHSSMLDTCRSFGGGTLPAGVVSTVGAINIPSDLRAVAATFCQLQFYRHQADYNRGRFFVKSEVLELVQDASDAFVAWQRVRNDDAARFFLMSLPLWDQMRRA
jgi:hypothetical protein